MPHRELIGLLVTLGVVLLCLAIAFLSTAPEGDE